MKKLIFSIFILSIAIACTNNSNERAIELKIKQDSRTVDSIRRVDSIRTVDSLSFLARDAWGDAKFGMTEKETLETDMFKNAYNGNYASDFKSLRTRTKIHNSGKSMNVEAIFFRNRLYQIKLEDWYRTANYFDTDVTETVEILYDLIKTKYGKPKTNKGMPSFMRMRPNHYHTAYQWVIGNKTIEIRVDEEGKGSRYRATCLIRNEKEYKPVKQYSDSVRKAKEETFVNPF